MVHTAYFFGFIWYTRLILYYIKRLLSPRTDVLTDIHQSNIHAQLIAIRSLFYIIHKIYKLLALKLLFRTHRYKAQQLVAAEAYVCVYMTNHRWRYLNHSI